MPSNLELYNEAERLKDEGKLEEAAAKADEIVAQDDSYALAHSLLAVVLTRLGRHADAIAHAEKVCELEPNDALSFSALSVAHVRAGHIQEAEDAMARARMIQGH